MSHTQPTDTTTARVGERNTGTRTRGGMETTPPQNRAYPVRRTCNESLYRHHISCSMEWSFKPIKLGPIHNSLAPSCIKPFQRWVMFVCPWTLAVVTALKGCVFTSLLQYFSSHNIQLVVGRCPIMYISPQYGMNLIEDINCTQSQW